MKFQSFFLMLLLGLTFSCVDPPPEEKIIYTITVRQRGDWGTTSPSLSLKAGKSVELKTVKGGNCFVLREEDFAKLKMTLSFPDNKKEICDNSYSSVTRCFDGLKHLFLDITTVTTDTSATWSYAFVSTSEGNPETKTCTKLY